MITSSSKYIAITDIVVLVGRQFVFFQILNKTKTLIWNLIEFNVLSTDVESMHVDE